MRIDDFLHKLRTQPESILFTDTMETIEANYDFTPVGFTNGTVVNEAGTNSGSCKLFAFAKLQQLSKEETWLALAIIIGWMCCSILTQQIMPTSTIL